MLSGPTPQRSKSTTWFLRALSASVALNALARIASLISSWWRARSNRSATYVGGGKDYFGGPLGLRDRIKALGRHDAVYDYSNYRCAEELPRPDIEHSFARTFSGRTVTGNICLQIASNDARSLRLFVAGPLSLRTLKRGRQVWFALP